MTRDIPVADTASAEHYTWGGVCDGWRLLDDPGLSVIQERVPPGAGEVKHFHSRAQQFFFVLTGNATLEFDDTTVSLGPGQGVHVAAGMAHRFANHSAGDVVFLVVSTPTTAGDRTNVGPPA